MPLQRVPAGRINAVHAPEGSILGPMWTGELVVVMENDEQGMKLGFATQEDLYDDPDDPKTWTEFQKTHRSQLMQRVRFAALFGGDPR